MATALKLQAVLAGLSAKAWPDHLPLGKKIQGKEEGSVGEELRQWWWWGTADSTAHTSDKTNRHRLRVRGCRR